MALDLRDSFWQALQKQSGYPRSDNTHEENILPQGLEQAMDKNRRRHDANGN